MTELPETKLSITRSLVFLILANVVCLIGVLFFAWPARDVLLLYWAESAVIGVYTVARLLLCRGETTAGQSRVFFVPFFIVHFGIFMGVHLAFLLFLTGQFQTVMKDGRVDLLTQSMSWGLPALFISHGVSFVVHFLFGDERDLAPQEIFMSPYPRIVVMHLTVLVGGALLMAFSSSTVLLALLVLIKTIADARAHRLQHMPKPVIGAS